MKEVKIQIDMLKYLFTKGNKINVEVIDGLDKEDKIVQILFDELNGVLTLWCDEHKIKKQEIVMKRMGDKE